MADIEGRVQGGTLVGATPNPTPLIQPDTLDRRPSFGDVALASFERFSPMVALGRTIERNNVPADPSFVPGDYIRQNGDKYSDILPMINVNPNRFANAESQEEFDILANQLRREIELIETEEAGGILPIVAGGLLSVVGDPLSLMSFMGSEFAAARLGSRALAGSRAYGAKTAAGGAVADAAVIEGVLQADQTLRTPEESLVNILAAGALGGALGGLLRSTPLGVSRPGKQLLDNTATPDNVNVAARSGEDLEDLRDEVLANLRGTTGQAARDAGAARRRFDTVGPLAPDRVPGGTIGVGKNTFLRRLNPIKNALINRRIAQERLDDIKITTKGGAEVTLRRAQEINDMTDDAFAKVSADEKAAATALLEAEEASGAMFQMVKRMIRMHVETENVRAGGKMPESMEDIMSRLSEFTRDRAQANFASNDKFMRVMGGRAMAAKRLLLNRNALKSGKDFRQLAENDARFYRLRQAADPDRAGELEVEVDENIKQLLSADEMKAYKEFVKEVANQEEKFYQRWADEMVKDGLLDEASRRQFYTPIIYDKTQVANNRNLFKSLLVERFQRRPDDEFVARYKAAQQFLDKGEQQDINIKTAPELDDLDPIDFDSLSKAEKEEIAEAWNIAVRQEAEEAVERKAREAEEALEAEQAQFNRLRGELGRAQKLIREKEAEVASARDELRKLEKNAIGAEERARLDDQYNRLLRHIKKLEGQLAEGGDDVSAPVPAFMRRGKELMGEKTPTGPVGKNQKVAKQIEVAQKQLDAIQKRRREARNTGALDAKIEAAKSNIIRKQDELGELQDAQFKKRIKFDEANKARRQAKRNAAKAAAAVRAFDPERMDPEKVAERVVKRMEQGGEAPLSILPDDAVIPSGRLKMRTIDWGDMATDPRLQEFLITDPQALAEIFTRDMGRRIASVRVFGDENPLKTKADLNEVVNDAIGRALKSGQGDLAKVLGEQRAEWDDLVTKLAARMSGEMEMEAARSAGWLSALSRDVRNANVLRLMGMNTLTSITDLATISAATHTPLRKVTAQMVKGIAQLPEGELKALLLGLENQMFFARSARQFDTDDLLANSAIRKNSKLRERFSALLDRGTQGLMVANGMKWWNTRARGVAGFLMLRTMGDKFHNLGQMSAKEAAYWGRHGIDKSDMELLDNYLHNTDLTDWKDGVPMPDLVAWRNSGKEGAKALETFVRTSNSVLDEAVIMPGFGDTPFLMSKPGWKMMLQFQTFGFGALERYVRPGVQANDVFHYMNFVQGMTLGLMSYAAKQFVRKGPIAGAAVLAEDLANFEERGDLKIFQEAFVRSPLMGAGSLPYEAAEQMLFPALNEATDATVGLRPFGATKKVMARGGELTEWSPAVSLGEDIYKASAGVVNSIIEGDAEGLAGDLVALTPLQTYIGTEAAKGFYKDEEFHDLIGID